MSSVVISGNTSGAITLSAPDVSGTNTATLPAATGTVMVSGNMPAFNGYSVSGSGFTLSTWTKVILNSEIFDTNNNFDTSNYRFTPTVAGYYMITACVKSNWSGGQFTKYQVAIYKNGTDVSQFVFDSGGTTLYPSFNTTILVYANGSTDYFETYVRAVGGSSPTYEGGASTTYMCGYLARSA